MIIVSTLDINILIFCEDPDLQKDIESLFKPVSRSVTSATSPAEAILKVNNQHFDLIIYRTLKPTLKDPNGLFAKMSLDKGPKKSSWIILGSDIESTDSIVGNSHVKFYDKYQDHPAFLEFAKTLFYKAAPKGSAAALDVSFINPIVKAVIDVVGSMGSVQLNRGKPFLKMPADPVTAEGDISGIIAMNSNRFVGSLAICFQENTILEIYKNMLGSPADGINDEVKDAVAELTNIIFGSAKKDLNLGGHTIALAIPSVVTGKNHQIRHSVKGHCICIPFECTHGKIVVEYVISPIG